MSRPIFSFLFVAALLLASPAAAQRTDVKNPMDATAVMKMTPPGETEPLRECDKLAMDDPQIKMEDRARFVKDCVARKMRERKP